MEDEEIQMIVDGEVYAIKPDELDEFKSDFPDAKEANKIVLEADGESYEIYETEEEEFLKDFPNAKRVDSKKKDASDSESSDGSSESQETVDDPIEQQRLAEVEGVQKDDKFNPVTGDYAYRRRQERIC